MSDSELFWILAGCQSEAVSWLLAICQQPGSKLNTRQAINFLQEEQARLQKLITSAEKRIAAEREGTPVQASLFDQQEAIA
jgi:hypothetical protein